MARDENRAFLRFQSQKEAADLQNLTFPFSYKLLNFRVKMTDTSTVSTTVLMRFSPQEMAKHKDTFTEDQLSITLGELMRARRKHEEELHPSQKPPDSEGPMEDPTVLLIPAMWNNEEYNGRIEFTRDRGGESVCCYCCFIACFHIIVSRI